MGLPADGSTEIFPMVDQQEKESKTPKEHQDIQKELEDLYNAIKVDNVDEVKRIMAIFEECDHDQMRLLTGGYGPPLVIAATRYISFKCLEYFMKLHEQLKGKFQDEEDQVEIDQVDGFIAKDKDGKNLNHLVALQLKGPQAEKAVEIFEPYSELLKDIINKTDAKKSPPLLTALKRNNEVVAKYLVQHGASFEGKINGQNLMKIAIVNGQLGTLKEMLNKVTDSENKLKLLQEINPFGDEDGHTILYSAASSGKDSIFSFLHKEIGKKFATTLAHEIRHKDFPKFLKNITSSGMEAAFETLMDFVETLAVGLKTNPDEGTPLIWAVKENKMKIVKIILESEVGKETVKIKDKNQKNVFHYAAEVDNDILQYLKKHLEEEYLNLYNAKDKRGCTPLHYAAVADNAKNVDFLLEENVELSNASVIHCRYCAKNSSYEILETILLKYKESNNEGAFSKFLEGENKYRWSPVHEAAYAGRTDILQLLRKLGASMESKSTYFNWTVLHFAVAGKSLPTVDFLIQVCPTSIINERSNEDETGAVLAAESGCAQILKHLLENGGKVFGKYPKENLFDCVIRYSHLQNRDKAALEIIKFCDKDGKIDSLRELMENSSYGPEGIMSKFLDQMPHVALEILNRCTKDIEDVTSNESDNDRTYHFFPIQDKTKKDNKALSAIRSMIKYQRYDCLDHPVVVTFLDKKWSSSTVRRWYFSNIVLYAAFLFSLTAYIAIQRRGTEKLTSSRLIGLSVVSIAVILFNFAKELIQMRFSWKEYFFDPNNYLELTLYTSAAIYLIPPSQEKTKLQIEAGVVAVLLAWINFIWFFKRISYFGIYIIMAKRVFTSLLKVLPMVILFIFAFSMAFFLLMNNDEGFQDIPISMLTTSVMMAGEIDFREVFLEKEGPHILLERVFVLGFLVIITIVIMNLLVGLAVGDTDKTMKRSKVEKRYYKASLIVTLQRSGVKLDEVVDPLPVNIKAEEKKMSWLTWLWEKLYRDVDDVEDTQIILFEQERIEASMDAKFNETQARLKKVEESIAHMTSLLETLSTQVKTAEDKE